MKVIAGLKNGQRTVTYEDENGNQIVKEGGTVSWRNNNEGNLKIEPWKSQTTKDNWAKSIGAIGVDQNGFAIFATEEAGREAKINTLSNKYGVYSIRAMLQYYAPTKDGNDPDLYANQIKQWTGLDVDNKKIRDLTSDEFGKLLEGMKRKERYTSGAEKAYDSKGILIYEIDKSVVPQQQWDSYIQMQVDSYIAFRRYLTPTGYVSEDGTVLQIGQTSVITGNGISTYVTRTGENTYEFGVIDNSRGTRTEGSFEVNQNGGIESAHYQIRDLATDSVLYEANKVKGADGTYMETYIDHVNNYETVKEYN
ncbi:MAG: hypothetical protein M1147_07440, partial [Nitrospirae bacterium]|nr:hypothetical protein [Nitrospirota bacterium]